MFIKKFDFHKAVGKNVTYSRDPHRKYCQGAPGNLVDGVRGPQVYKSVEWTAWHGKPVDIVVDMGQTEPYSSVILGFLSAKPSYIFLPQNVTVSVSEDGVNYVEVASQEYGIEEKDAPDTVSDFVLSFSATSAKYLKLTVTPVLQMPDWHYAAGKRTFFFLDEIIVK